MSDEPKRLYIPDGLRFEPIHPAPSSDFLQFHRELTERFARQLTEFCRIPAELLEDERTTDEP